jgi:hypothetical protein
MTRTFNYKASFEERELAMKRDELARAASLLAQREQTLLRLSGELHEFEEQYNRTLGARIAELDDLERRITELSSGNMTFVAGKGKADHGHAEQERSTAGGTRDELPVHAFRQRALKDLYRSVAKAVHPDLAESPADCLRRQKIMAEANSAYADGDMATLEALLYQWETDSYQVGMSELERITRRIAATREKIRTVEAGIVSLKGKPLYRLFKKMEDHSGGGYDMLAELAAKLDASIAAARRELWELNGRNGAGLFARPDIPVRVIVFPDDGTKGTLSIRNCSSDNFLDWQCYSEASGPVSVPDGKALRLDIQDASSIGLEFLRSFRHDDLNALFLYKADDEAIGHLTGLTGLEQLYLQGEKVTTAGVRRLKALNGLKRLYLYETALGDESIWALREMSGLKWLTVSGGKISSSALQRLQGDMPGCRIVNLPVKKTKQAVSVPS